MAVIYPHFLNIHTNDNANSEINLSRRILKVTRLIIHIINREILLLY